MIKDTEYATIYQSESIGGSGAFGIRIQVYHSANPNLSFREDSNIALCDATYAAARMVSAEVQAVVLAKDASAHERAKRDRDEIIGLFPNPIFVEEIPNGYCPDWCCRHLPWFVVTTSVGRFKIGWRKSVISIEWDQTVGTLTSEQLFKDEDVTKNVKMIHAWGIEKAREYVNRIITTAEKNNG